jgi:hypothetical protein
MFNVTLTLNLERVKIPLQNKYNYLKRLLSSFIFSLLLLFSGCGGGDSASNKNSSSPLSKIINGTAVDGYISGAAVCLDTNKNDTCEVSEPSTSTQSDGTFSLTTTVSGDYLIIISGGTDMATGESFVGTLKNIIFLDVTNSSVDTKITPLTTLVANIYQDEVKNNPSFTLTQAKQIVATNLDLNLSQIEADPLKDKKVFAKTQQIVQTIKLLSKSIQSDESDTANNNKAFNHIMKQMALSVKDDTTSADLNVSKVIKQLETTTYEDTTIDISSDVEDFTKNYAQEIKLKALAITDTNNLDNLQNDFKSFINEAKIKIANNTTDILTSTLTSFRDKNTTAILTQSNTPPTISGTPITSIDELQAYSFTPIVSDTNHDKLTFSISNKPSWATFSTSSGKLSGTANGNQSGTYADINISVTDSIATVTLPIFTITVNNTSDNSSSNENNNTSDDEIFLNKENDYNKTFTKLQIDNIIADYDSYLDSNNNIKNNIYSDPNKYEDDLGLISRLSQIYLYNKDIKTKEKLEKYTKHILDNIEWTYYNGSGKYQIPYFLKTEIAKALKGTDTYNNIKEKLHEKLELDNIYKNIDKYTGTNNTKYVENNSDDIYLYAKLKLLYGKIYIEKDKKVNYFNNFKEYLENWTKHKRSEDDGIKIDGLGFHHKAHYNGYMYSYDNYILTLYLLQNTSFQISKKTYYKFRDAILALDIMSNGNSPEIKIKKSSAISLAGRNPFYLDNRVPVLDSKDSLIKLIDISKDILGEVDSKIVALTKRLYPKYYTEYSNISASSIPNGFWQFNYGHFSAFRQDDWLAITKGINRFAWGSEIYAKENRYGRYSSFGAIEIIYKDGLEKSGMSMPGWDWNMPPGTTTIHLPFEKLVAKADREDIHNPDSLFATAISFGGTDNFKYEIQGELGVYATYLSLQGLSAYKSVFSYDGKILSIGSNISSTNANGTLATNIFQISTKDNNTIYINNSQNTDTQLDRTITDVNTTFIDPAGTGYFIKSNSKIVIKKQSQTTPNEHKDMPNATADFASAYIDHGITPINKSYEYIIVPKTTNTLFQAINFDYYEILKQDNSAHIVRYKEENIYNYVLFSSNINLPNNGPLVSNDTASMIIIKENNSIMSLKLINPNYRSSEQTNIVLKGKWTIKNPHNSIEITKQSEIETHLRFTSIDGLGITIHLEDIGASFNVASPNAKQLNITKDSDTILKANYTFTDPNNYDEQDSNISWYYKKAITNKEQIVQTGTTTSYNLPSDYLLGDLIKFSISPKNINNIVGKPQVSNWKSPHLPDKLVFEDMVRVSSEFGNGHSNLGGANKFEGIAVKIPGNQSDIYSFTHKIGLSFWYPTESNSTIGIYKLNDNKTQFNLMYLNTGKIAEKENYPHVDIDKNVFVRGGDIILFGGIGDHDKTIRGSNSEKFNQFEGWNDFTTDIRAYFTMNYDDGLPLIVNIDDIETSENHPYKHDAYIKKIGSSKL